MPTSNALRRWWERLRLWLILRLLVGYARRAGPRPPMDATIEAQIREEFPVQSVSPARYAAGLWHDDLAPGGGADQAADRRLDRWLLAVAEVRSDWRLLHAARRAYLPPRQIQAIEDAEAEHDAAICGHHPDWLSWCDLSMIDYVADGPEQRLDELPAGAFFLTRDTVYAIKSADHYPNGHWFCQVVHGGEHMCFPAPPDLRVRVAQVVPVIHQWPPTAPLWEPHGGDDGIESD